MTFDQARRAKHLIAVAQETSKGLKFIGNVEFDAMSGGSIRGSNSADATPDAGVQEIRELLAQAREEGHSPAILILDAAYQFAVSIGMYVSTEEVE